MSRVAVETLLPVLRQFPPGKPREAAPDTPFAAYLNEPSAPESAKPERNASADRSSDATRADSPTQDQAAENTADSQDDPAVAEPAGDAESETADIAAFVNAPMDIVVPSAELASSAEIVQGATAPSALLRTSSPIFGELPGTFVPQNTPLQPLPGPNNDNGPADIASPAAATGQPESASAPEPAVGGVAADIAAPIAVAAVSATGPQSATPSATQETAAATTALPTSPAIGQVAANVASAPAEEADSLTPSLPGADANDGTEQPKQRSAGGESFEALVRKAADATSQQPPPGDDEAAAFEAAKPGTDGPSQSQTSQLQTSNAAPQPMAERLGHLTPAAPAAHTGQAATAETTAAVSVAGLALEIAARAQSGHTRFEIRLDPPELGRIDVRLDVDQRGQVTSRLVVEKAETLDLLKRDAPELERALQQAGLKTGDGGLQFALRDQAFAGRDDRPAQQMARVVVSDAELPAVETVQSGYGRWLRSDGGIDIRV